MGRAAAAHQISQPSASVRLARLERQIGAALVIRGPRGSALTLTGQAVLAWARPVVESAHRLSDGIATLRSDRSARLRVAASLTIAEYLLPTWLLLLRRSHPDLETAVEVVNSQGVVEHVRAGVADVGFVETPEAPQRLSAARVGQDRIALVVAANYPLAARARQPLWHRDIVDQPLLLREPGSGTRETFLTALGVGTREHPSLTHTIELGSTTMIVATALAGGGIGVVSARAVEREIAAHNLVELRLDGIELHRPLHAVWAGQHPAPLVAELIEIARSATSELA